MSKWREIFRLYDAYDLRLDEDSLSEGGLGPDELDAQTLRSAVSPGTELAAYSGLQPLRPTENPYPRLMGYCNVARVLGCGAEVEAVKEGDIILTHQPHCSEFRITEGEVLCRLEPSDDLNEMSTTYLFHLGYSAALKGGVTAGHNVAVVGLGTLGLTASAVAHLCGANDVVGYTNHPPSAQTAQDFRLAKILPKEHTDYASSFDVVIMTSNSWDDWRLSLMLARTGGTIVLIGFPGRAEGSPDFNPLSSEFFYDKQLTIKACGKTFAGSIPREFVRFSLKDNCSYLSSVVRSGRLPASSLIHSVIGPSDLVNGYEKLLYKRSDAKTLIIDWT